MHLYKTLDNYVLSLGDEFRSMSDSTDWDVLINRDDLRNYLELLWKDASQVDDSVFFKSQLLPPIGNQEVWASGVTYYSSRLARMEESEGAGGGDFYSRVYQADRPELFFKATPNRVVGHGQNFKIRSDSTWDVPEPELTLFATTSAKIVAYTIGNDVSSRSIEGENPLYLPQAKTFDKCACLGPGLYVPKEPISMESKVKIKITRDGNVEFNGETILSEMKRSFEELVGFLFRECSFNNGVFLMTGTGIVPGKDFTLHRGDQVEITIDSIGTLVNSVE
jgi:2-dehydro-3-deoxy-D-arabinonate dehydratase